MLLFSVSPLSFPSLSAIQVFFQPVTYTVAEGDSATVILAVSSVNYDLSVTVNLAYVDLSANRDADYIPSSTSVVFNPGQATATLQIHTLASHEVQELSEVFAVTILGVSPPLVVGDNNTAHITITDTDGELMGGHTRFDLWCVLSVACIAVWHRFEFKQWRQILAYHLLTQ